MARLLPLSSPGYSAGLPVATGLCTHFLSKRLDVASSPQASLTITPVPAVPLSSLSLNPASVRGGNSATETVTLSSAAPSSASYPIHHFDCDG
jgi:hypothetical protein